MHWILGVVIAAVVVVGGGYYAMHGGYTMSNEPTQKQAEAQNEAAQKLASGAFTGSWNDLVQRGGNYTCEITQDSAVASTGGTVYVSGTDVRGEFSSVTPAGTVQSFMLKKADMMYVWGGGMPQGIIMKVDAQPAQAATTGTSGEGVDQNQSYSWNCSATGVNAASFELPPDVKFMDMAQMMQGMGSIPGVPGR